MRYSSFAFWLLCLLPSIAFAGAWTLEEDQWQLIETGSYYGTNRYVDSKGDSYGGFTYQKWEEKPYLEYGLTPDITLGATTTIPYIQQDIPGVSYYTWGLADTEFFVRKRMFFDGDNVISIQPLIKIPGPYDSDSPVPLGQGQVDAELRALYGHTFSEDLYVDAEIAYRHRFGFPGDEIRLAASAGYFVTSWWQVVLKSDAIFAVNGADDLGFISNGFNYDLVKLQLSDIFWLSDSIAVELGLFQHVYARNTGAGGGVLLSLWFRL